MSVLPLLITDLDEMRRPVRFVPIARDTLRLLPLGSLVQFQTAVPAWVQRLSALGPHLERGELSYHQLGNGPRVSTRLPLNHACSLQRAAGEFG